MALYLPIRAHNRSSRLRIDGQTIVPPNTFYIDISKATVRKELASHSSIGQWYPAGDVTLSNSDYLILGSPTPGGVVTNGAGLTVNVSTGEFRNRQTGATVTGAAATNFALTVADAVLDRTDLIVWDGATGAVGKTDGTLATAGNSVAPATPAGKVQLYTVLVAATVTAPGTKTDIRNRI